MPPGKASGKPPVVTVQPHEYPSCAPQRRNKRSIRRKSSAREFICDTERRCLVGEVRALPVVVQDVRLADAAREFLGTIAVPNTRRGYAVALNRLCKDFGADSGTAGLDPDRVGGWFTFVWGKASPQTFNVRWPRCARRSTTGANRAGWPEIRWCAWSGAPFHATT